VARGGVKWWFQRPKWWWKQEKIGVLTKHGGALSYKVGVFCTFTGQNGLRSKKHGFDSHELRSEPTEVAYHC